MRCRKVWHAEPSRADKLVDAAAAIAPDDGVAEPDWAVETTGSAAFQESLGAARNEHRRPEPAGEQPLDDGPTAHPSSFSMAEDDDSSAPTSVAVGRSDDATDQSVEVEAPPIAPADLDEGRPPIDVGSDHTEAHRPRPAEDIETVAARRQQRHRATRPATRWPLSRLQTGILALVLVDAILIGWRRDIVRVLPQTASFYALLGMPVNLRGLVFDGVTATTEQNDGVPILVIEGNVVNAARKMAEVPRIKLIVRNAARQEIYSWTAVPSRTGLPPGEAVAFGARLASPPSDAQDLILRFVTRRDLVGGTR